MNSKTISTCRHGLATMLLAGVTFAYPFSWANAQESSEAVEPEIEEVIVTGSRISRANESGSTPVVQVESDEVSFQGTVRIEDMLRNLPQVWSDQNTGQSNGATGTATVNLRNLGDPRTLVLLNGRRLPPGSPIGGGNGVDVNQIPGALVKRVEVLTGGASATYGSDAVSGVINFIMDDDFEGVSIDVQSSGYSHGNSNSEMHALVKSQGFEVADDHRSDGEIRQTSLVLGGDIAGRGHAVAYYTYRDINAVRQSERDYSSCALNNAADACWGSSTIPEGRVTNFGNAKTIGFDYKVDGTEFVPRAGTLFNYGPLNYFQRPDTRHSFGTFANYEIDDQLNVYTELMFMDDRTVSQVAPSGAFFITSRLSCANPLMSDQQYNALTMDRLSSDQRTALDAFIASQKMTNPNFDEMKYLDDAFCQNRTDDFITAFLGRRNVEGGERQQDLRHTSFRYVFGAEYEINANWLFDVSVQKGIVSMENTYLNDLSTSKIRNALDAVLDANGNIVCRSVVNGTDPNCVPWNIFETGAVEQDMIDYLVLPLFARGTTDQTATILYVEGDLTDAGWVMPGADSGLITVLGYEHRNEGLDFNPDVGFRTGEGAGQGGASNPVKGSFDVDSYFLEASLPLVENAELAELINLDMSLRQSQYSTGVDATSYGLRSSWRVNPDITFRASVQRAVRAANVRELFSPTGFNLFDMNADPCAGLIDANGMTEEGRTFQECARSGVTQTHWGNIQNSPAGQYNFLQGGNTELEPEVSDTYIIGLVWQPGFADGLSVSVDYFNIRIEEGISAISPEFTLNECLDGNDLQCEKVNRSRNLGDLWIGSDVNSSGHIVALQDNLAIEEVHGLDVIGRYSMDVGELGRIDFHNVLAYILKWDQQEIATSEVVDCNGYWGGECGNPTATVRNNLRAVWETPWSATLTAMWRFTSQVDQWFENRTDSTKAVDLDAASYFDVAGVYYLGETYTFKAGVNNVLDQAPPLAGNGAGPTIGGNGNIFPGIYDLLGRYTYFGVTVNF